MSKVILREGDTVYVQSPCLTGDTECVVRFDLDWLLLARQKNFLLSLMDTYGDGLLDGVVALIDHIQDTAEEQGQPVVFASEYDEEEHA